MSKYTRLCHVPLERQESQTVAEEFETLHPEEGVGEFLKNLRETQGWTQAQLGEKIGLGAEHILMMETGLEPISLKVAKQLSTLFSLDYRYFL